MITITRPLLTSIQQNILYTATLSKKNKNNKRATQSVWSVAGAWIHNHALGIGNYCSDKDN